MTIIVKNKETIIFDDFQFKCCVGKKGIHKKKLKVTKKHLKENLKLEIYTLEKIE